MRTAVALVAGFAAGLFAAAFSTQFRAALAAAQVAQVDPIAAEAQEAAAYLRSMGVDVGVG
jgi:hypothetical protein